MILRVLAQFVAAVQIRIFLKILDFILVKNVPVWVKNIHFQTIFTFEDLRYHHKDKEVDDTKGIGTVQIQIFSKILDFIFGKKWAILGQKISDYFHF